jgi:hypothetical protein
MALEIRCKKPAVELACGQIRFRVAADSTRCVTIPAPAQSGDYPLTIDGREAGPLDSTKYLVDV